MHHINDFDDCQLAWVYNLDKSKRYPVMIGYGHGTEDRDDGPTHIFLTADDKGYIESDPHGECCPMTKREAFQVLRSIFEGQFFNETSIPALTGQPDMLEVSK